MIIEVLIGLIIGGAVVYFGIHQPMRDYLQQRNMYDSYERWKEEQSKKNKKK